MQSLYVSIAISKKREAGTMMNIFIEKLSPKWFVKIVAEAHPKITGL
jgi:hypothetical protein